MIEVDKYLLQAVLACLAPFAAACGMETIALTNECATLSFDGRGRIASIREAGSGRELLMRPTPFVALRLDAGEERPAEQLDLRDGFLEFALAQDAGRVALRPVPFAGGVTFEVAEVTGVPPCAAALVVGQTAPACREWLGRRANMQSDDESGVCVRAYDLFGDMECGDTLCAVLPADKMRGARFGIVAAERSRLQAALQAMTLASGRPHSPAGGAWALGSEATRGSYLNAWKIGVDTLDDWMDALERGGFDILHFREPWYASRGHYTVNTNLWPNGLADLKAAVARVHAAGYRAGMHTLTGCIDPADPWVSGPENRNLLAWETYTLAADLTADAGEMTVNEPPRKKHDVVFTYSGNGNAIRIGNEIVQFSSFTEKPPYKYSGLTRGAFGTKAAAHVKGDEAAYLQQRYQAFYPDPDSPLADALADAIANVYRTCGFDMIYCDGTEGMMSEYGMAAMRDKIIGRCAADGRPCLNEDSHAKGSPRWWWYHSRMGAWDWPQWADKRFHDMHIDTMLHPDVRKTDMMELQMGWWTPRLGEDHFPTQMLDDMEYYASRNAGLDVSMSIFGHILSKELPMNFHVSRLLTVLGWYERARRARAFVPGMQKKFSAAGAEFRLRQNAEGAWETTPVRTFSHRARSAESAKMSFALNEKPTRSALRILALHVGAKGEDGNRLLLTEGVRADGLKCSTAGAQVSLSVAETKADDGRRAFRLSVANAGGGRRGAWARATASFRPYRSPHDRWVLRFGARGDGSGALLNVQLETPREYGQSFSEHYVTLDFTGWRDFEMPMRERDVERFLDYEWPYRHPWSSVFHRKLNTENVSAVNFYLNEIPAGGRAVAEVTDVTLVPQRVLRAERHAVILNGREIVIPFALESGCFAELEEGVWTLYSFLGEPLERRRTGDAFELSAGANEIAYGGTSSDGTRPCAELTVFALGSPVPALKPVTELSAAARRFLSCEAAEPQLYAPAKGFDVLKPLAVRPGEEATTEVVVYGPMPACTLVVGNEETALPAVAVGKHRRFTLNGLYRGVLPVAVAQTAEGEASARFEFVKRYQNIVK